MSQYNPNAKTNWKIDDWERKGQIRFLIDYELAGARHQLPSKWTLQTCTTRQWLQRDVVSSHATGCAHLVSFCSKKSGKLGRLRQVQALKAPGRPWKALQAVTAFSPTAQESPKTSPRRCNAPASAKEAKEQAHQKCVYLNSSNFILRSLISSIFREWKHHMTTPVVTTYVEWPTFCFCQPTRGLCHCRPQLGTLSDDATFPQRDEVEPQRKTHRVSRQ